MKKLLLLRHANAEKLDSSVGDLDRPLNDLGTRAASLLGSFIAKRGIQPDLVMSSPAKRAKQTASLVIEATGITTVIDFDERIYEARVSELLTVVKQFRETANVALLIGHNPGFENFQTYLSGQARHMSTAALACLTLDIENWSDVHERCAELDCMITPDELEQVYGAV